jgi:ADP-ribose pyrophosphatase
MIPDELQTLCAGQYLRFVKRGKWEFCTRPNIGGIVGILAVTDDGKLILIEQFRPPVMAKVIEIPAGLAGDNAAFAGEDLSVAAARELEEETGYRAAKLEKLTQGASSAGLCDEIISLYRATGLTKVSHGGGDEHENIAVHEVPLPEVPAFLEDRRKSGVVIDLKVYAALYFAR